MMSVEFMVYFHTVFKTIPKKRLLIWLLSVMRFPLTFSNLHFRKYSFEGRVLWRTCINAKPYSSIPALHMADPHLTECDSVCRTFNTIIILPPAEAIPHCFYRRRNLCCCPVRVSVVRNYTSQMLIFFIFILYGNFLSYIMHKTCRHCCESIT